MTPTNNTFETAKGEILTFLESHKVADVNIPAQKVVEVLSTMTPVEAAKLLWENKIMGAPVWDPSTEKYCGFFDMRDMLSTVIAADKDHEMKKYTKGYHFLKWFEKLEKSSKTDSEKVAVSSIAARNPFLSLTEEATLKQVCDLLSTRNCHRVPIVDKESGRCVRIFSQSGLLKFLAEHLLANKTTALQAIDAYFEQTLVQAAFPYKKKVVTLKETVTAREVFEAMDSKGLSGIAIVDEHNGSLIGNTSASDIKLTVSFDDDDAKQMMDDGTDTSILNGNIISYLSLMRQQSPTHETRHPSSRVRETSTLGHTICLLAATGYHRMFVVDETNVPVGVMSVSDIVAFLAGNPSI